MSRPLLLLALATALINGCATAPPPAPARAPMPEFTSAPPPVSSGPAANDQQVRATIVPGSPVQQAAPMTQNPPRGGDVTLNFPAADVNAVAKAVLGDILNLPYVVTPGLTTPVTLVTPTAVPRSAVFAVLEEALKAANLAITQQGGVFTIRPLDQARGQPVIDDGNSVGFASETVMLQFVNAEEMKKLLDGILPGVVQRTDPGQNSIVIAGTTGQRTNARNLLKQFDVNWLRSMSFALIVPQRTDARLIVPELNKLINAPDAPTRGLVRLIAMEQLNGILAITAQRQYLDDVRRWIEILDREGSSNERRLFVYRVQNGRSKDLAKVLNTAFGNSGGGGDATAGQNNDFALDGSARSGGATGNGGNFNANDPNTPGNRPIDVPPVAGGIAGSPQGRNGSNGASASAIDAIISSDEANNAIIVFGTPRDYAIIEDALRRLDILPLQVLIEAAITEVTLNDRLRFGVQWNFQSGDSNFALTDNATAIPGRIFPGFSFFFSNKSSITAALNALQAETDVNVLSAPKLMVLNNQTAALQIGDQVPVATQSAVGVVNPGAPIVNSIEYRDTGVILKITPRVNASGLVLLDVSQEVSDVKQTDSSNLNSPTISTRRIATTIAVQDNQIIALGGLIRDSETRGRSGVPGLSQIPVLGPILFGKTSNDSDRTELLVLLKPRVIRTPDDAQAVTDELRAKIRSIQPIIKGDVP